MNLSQMMELAERQARHILVGRKKELMPQWLLLFPDGKIKVIGTPWRDDMEKHIATEYLRKHMHEGQVVAYSLLVEAWFAHLPADADPYDGPRPRDRPDRKEGVVIMAVDKEGEHLHRHFEIVRDAKGRCTEFVRMDGPEDRINSLLFDNLLETRKPS